MKRALLVLATGLSLSAAAKPSQVQIQVEAGGERSFSVLAPCTQIKGVLLADAHTEILSGELENGTKVNLKVAFKPPQLVDAVHRGKPFCSGRCPSGYAPLPVSAGNAKQYVLACTALVN